MPNPRAIRLIAKPLLLSNHCETIFAQPSIKEPWPKNLKKPNPTVNIKKLDAAPKNMHDIPKIILIIIKLDLDPYLSISFRIWGSKNAAQAGCQISVPAGISPSKPLQTRKMFQLL